MGAAILRARGACGRCARGLLKWEGMKQYEVKSMKMKLIELSRFDQGGTKHEELKVGDLTRK